MSIMKFFLTSSILLHGISFYTCIYNPSEVTLLIFNAHNYSSNGINDMLVSNRTPCNYYTKSILQQTFSPHTLTQNFIKYKR